MKSFYTILFLIIFYFTQAQTIDLTSFDKKLLGFEFKGTFDSRIWPSKNNMKSLILIKDGEYSIQRKYTIDEEIIVPNWDNLYRNFEIQASIKILPSENSNPTAGICFNMSKDLNSGYVLELNGDREFCIKRIIKQGKYLYISNQGTKSPWVKFKKMGKKEEYNTVSIMVKGNAVDIYIDNYFAISFSDDNSGADIKNFGIYIGPASNAVLNLFNFNVSSNENLPDFTKTDNNSSQQISQEENNKKDNPVPDKPDKPANTTQVDTGMTNLMILMKNQLDNTRNELRDSKILLNRCKDDNLRLNDFISQNVNSKLSERIKQLQQQYNDLKAKYDALVINNQTLETFKQDCLNTSKDKDMVKMLYEQLNATQKENEKLKLKLKELEGK
jgi:hypothetical protein